MEKGGERGTQGGEAEERKEEVGRWQEGGRHLSGDKSMCMSMSVCLYDCVRVCTLGYLCFLIKVIKNEIYSQADSQTGRKTQKYTCYTKRPIADNADNILSEHCYLSTHAHASDLIEILLLIPPWTF